jgi:hypothetical protein
MIKAIWAFSAVLAVGVGLLLPAPALLGGRHHHLIDVGAARP